jgi:hypothetical protein
MCKILFLCFPGYTGKPMKIVQKKVEIDRFSTFFALYLIQVYSRDFSLN